MGIVRPEGTDVNDIGLLGQVPGAEEQAPTVTPRGKPAQTMQPAEMISGVPGAGSRFMETQEGLVLARQHGLHVGKDLVAELGTVHVSAEPGQLVAAPAPTCDETLACHAGTRMMSVQAPTELSEPAAPSCHSVLSDLAGRSQASASLQCSRTGEARRAHGSRR